MLFLWLTCTVAFLGYLWSRRRFYWLAWKLRGPLGLPFIGAWQLLNPENWLTYTSRITKEYNSPATVWIGPTCFVEVYDPENFEKISKAPECLNKSVIYKPISRLIGNGLISNNNPTWSVHRKVLNPFFSHRTLLSFFPVMNTEADISYKMLKELADTNTPSNIINILQEYTLNIAAQTIIEEKRYIQKDDLNELRHTTNMLIKMEAKEISNPLYSFDYFTKLFDPRYYENRQKGLSSINKLTKMFVSDSLSRHKLKMKTMKEVDGDLTKLQTFLEYEADLVEKELFSVQEMSCEFKHIYVAAYETSYKTLHYIITLLAIHPEWQEKLYEEIKQNFPDKHFDVTYEHFQNLPLTEMIIKESLRLLPSLPIIGKITETDFQLNDDVILPKGINILINIYHMHRNPKYWGPDANKFNPYHFLPDAVRERHPYAFLPFSKGRRMCIGWQYAYYVLKIFVVKIFRNFQFTTKTKAEDIELVFSVSSSFKVDPLFEIRLRSD